MRKDVKILLCILPPLIIITLFFLFPLFVSFDRSFHDIDGNYIGFSAYSSMFSSRTFNNAFWYTVKISLLSTVIAVFVAIVIAMALRRTFIGKKISLFLFQFNASIPHISVASMMLLLLLPLGLISSMAFQLGMIDSSLEFPMLVRGSSAFGTVFSFAWKFAPFIGLAVLAVLQSAAPEYEQQAATLGVGPMRRFRYIILPMIKPAIFSSAIICFAFAFGSYEVPWMLGNSDTLASLSYNIFNSPVEIYRRAEAYAISSVITAVTLAVSIVYFYLMLNERRSKT